jgi:hypothetical protein
MRDPITIMSFQRALERQIANYLKSGYFGDACSYRSTHLGTPWNDTAGNDKKYSKIKSYHMERTEPFRPQWQASLACLTGGAETTVPFHPQY